MRESRRENSATLSLNQNFIASIKATFYSILYIKGRVESEFYGNKRIVGGINSWNDIGRIALDIGLKLMPSLTFEQDSTHFLFIG